mgnify:CR=1 FL=1
MVAIARCGTTETLYSRAKSAKDLFFLPGKVGDHVPTHVLCERVPKLRAEKMFGGIDDNTPGRHQLAMPIPGVRRNYTDKVNVPAALTVATKAPYGRP